MLLHVVSLFENISMLREESIIDRRNNHMGVESIAVIVRNVAVLVLYLSARHKFFESDRFCVGSHVNTLLKKSDKDILLERRGRSVNVHVSCFKIQRHHRHDFHVCQTGAVISKTVSFARCILDEILFTRLKRDK